MSHEECRQVLGVPPDATAEAIRQAYHDLARVWHPDRFQSDDRLRKIAEDHLREINGAYSILKSSRPAPVRAEARAGSRPGTRSATATATATQEPPAAAKPCHPAATFSWTFPRRFRSSISVASLLGFVSNKAAYAAILVLLLTLPFLAISKLAGLIRIPVPDTRVASFQPNIPSPMQIVDPNGDAKDASKAVTSWVRGETGDLWKAVRDRAADSPATVLGAEDNGTKPNAHESRNRRKQPASRTPHPAPPNGADLIPNPHYLGAGELRVSNHTGLEAVFKLVNEHGTLRAVYVTPDGSVTLRSIPIGVYRLQVDLGTNLDVERLQFLSDPKSLAPVGPFQFIEVTSEKGTSGKHYEVVVNPQTASGTPAGDH